MKYLLLKHYRGGPTRAVEYAPMDQWTPQEVDAHLNYMHDFAARLEGTGEFVDGQALAPEGAFVRYDGEGRPPVTDGPFAETKDLIAEKQAGLEDGTFDEFAGPINDTTGAEKIAAGEAPTLDELLTMEWYVEGIETTK